MYSRYSLLCPFTMEEQSNFYLIIGINLPCQNNDTIICLLVEWQKKHNRYLGAVSFHGTYNHVTWWDHSCLNIRTIKLTGPGDPAKAHKNACSGLLGVIMKGATPVSTHWFLAHGFWLHGKRHDKYVHVHVCLCVCVCV